MNPYAQTLLDPFNVRGVKIPDECLTPSIAFTIVDRRTLTVNAQGIAGCCYGYRSALTAVSVGSLVPVKISSDAGASHVVGFTFGTAATAADVTAGTLNTTGPIDLKLAQWQASVPTVQSLFDKVRLVSAGLNVQFTGNFTNNSGKYTAAFVPRDYSRVNGGLTHPISYLALMPGARQVPVSQNTGVTVLYEPLDSISTDYTQIGLAPDGTELAWPVVSATSWRTLLGQAEGGELWVAIDGSVAATTFQVTTVLNYEAIPLKESLLMNQTSASQKADPIAYSHAFNIAASSPNVFASSGEAQGTASGLGSDHIGNSASAPNLAYHPAPPTTNSNSGSMMDSVLGMITDPSTISKGMSMIEKFSPLIEAGLALI